MSRLFMPKINKPTKSKSRKDLGWDSNRSVSDKSVYERM